MVVPLDDDDDDDDDVDDDDDPADSCGNEISRADLQLHEWTYLYCMRVVLCKRNSPLRSPTFLVQADLSFNVRTYILMQIEAVIQHISNKAMQTGLIH